MEKQLTDAAQGHILTNAAVWSPDSQWLVYDTRSDPAGAVFDGTRIERVNVATGAVQVLYESQNGACCGVATSCPVDERVLFILGPEHPTADWPYAAWHRRGVIVQATQPGETQNLDACNFLPPFIPGALRGGTHLHTFGGDGQWVAFTYEDHVLLYADAHSLAKVCDNNQRNVGVSVPGHPVAVRKNHPHNQDGTHFSVLVTRTVNDPQPGSDEISRACEEAWVGTNGYLKADGSRQRRALAFQGQVRTGQGESIAEVFLVDLPGDVTKPSVDGPLEGTATRRPRPPLGTEQRRLTFTADRKYPGLQGPRHWLRSTPDGSRIAFLMKDDAGVVQLWTIVPWGSPPVQVTNNPWSIASAFTWSPDGRWITHVMDGSVCITEMATGQSQRLTPGSEQSLAPRPEACVFSPDGLKIAYVRPVPQGERIFNQLFVFTLDAGGAVQ